MSKTMPHLNDEHMQMYEWSGTGIGGTAIPAKSKRTHPWRASSAVLGVLTSLLVLNGCDNQDSAEQASEQIEQRVKDKMPELKDEMADVGILLFELAHNLGVDLGQAMLDKIERNETRYPVAKARGSNAKYNEL